MRFSQYVDEDIASLASAIAGCETTDSFLERIEILAREIHSPNRRDRRAARIAALARATTSARMREQLSLVQARMTDSFADLFRELQERGIVSRDFAPKMYATFIQAYSIGKVIDDVTADHVDPEEWTRFVMKMISDWATEGARA
jgi:hypothetical protein